MQLSPALDSFLRVFFDSALDIVPLFLLAIFVGAFIEEFVSERFIERFLTGRNPGTMAPLGKRSRLRAVWRHFLSQVKEYAPWVLVSLILAALVDQLVPGHWIQILYGQRTTVGSLLASVSGVPFYFCSGAELPLVRE